MTFGLDLPIVWIMDKRKEERPSFPKRAIITGGMPYGNKNLHFGHIGGVFVHADVFARFLRDRIGEENVIFVSGTDCYGSPIVENHRQLKEKGEVSGTVQDFVQYNHEQQKTVLDKYMISLNLFAASSFGPAHQIHENVCGDFLKILHENGHLIKDSQPQFYDPEFDVFLNGRQVIGRCPVVGCKSEKAYADECDLGHQIAARDLIAPKSTLSGKPPIMKEVSNWYIDMEKFQALLEDWLKQVEATPGCRKFTSSALREFLEPPAIYVKEDLMEEVYQIKDKLPAFTEEEGRSKSLRLVFENLAERERACEILNSHSIRFRTGKTLVPFRLTGNLDWGLKAPDIEDLKDLTFWVWPESLIAPISFSRAYLKSKGREQDWKDFWLSPEAKVYQFIGEDNLYFYGLAEIAMFLGMQKGDIKATPKEGDYQLPHLIVNNHILFLDKKASSSGKVKPPMAADLLDYYTPEQLRAHFFSLGLGLRSVGFKPKHLNPKANERDADPVLKEGNLLSNVLNKAIRSCLYTTQQYCDGKVPVGEVRAEIREAARDFLCEFENYMYVQEFHQSMAAADRYIREINKFWTRGMTEIKNAETEADKLRKQLLVDAFHMLRTAALAMHSVAPRGTEMLREYLNFGPEFFSWEHAFEDIYYFMADPSTHQFKFLEPRVDFFEKHESQYK